MTEPGSSETILIVDDTLVNLRLLSQMLIQQGFHVRAVTSGSRALVSVRASVPDLILLDVAMPEMDGYEVCRQIKADEASRAVPIIFISALDSPGDKVRAFQAGGVDYITKPFYLEEVVARVRTHLALSDLRRRLEEQLAERDQLIAELDTFAHTVAHELKNPLAIVLLLADMLIGDLDEMEPEDIRSGLQRVVSTGHKMVSIVDELMLLAGVRKMQITPVPLDMGALGDVALLRLMAIVDQAAAEIRRPPEATWPVVLGHGPWVEEIWANYVSNACKYGASPIILGYATAGHYWPSPPDEDLARLWAAIDGPERMAVFWVRDHGPGIAPEDQKALFAPFARLGRPAPESHGLGLSIVQRIVTRMGGQAGLLSDGQPGRGCLFYFALPIAP